MFIINDPPPQIAPARLALLLKAEPATIGHFRQTGFMDPAIRALLPDRRIAGTAVTVRFDGDDTAIDDIHVLIDAHGELQRGAALAVGRREPQPVEEARVAGADMIEGGRKLVPDGIVEFGQHDVQAFFAGGRAAIEKGKRSARSRKRAIIRG